VKVKDLIAKLQQFDENLDVAIQKDGGKWLSVVDQLVVETAFSIWRPGEVSDFATEVVILTVGKESHELEE